jgi:hypothetical protein
MNTEKPEWCTEEYYLSKLQEDAWEAYQQKLEEEAYNQKLEEEQEQEAWEAYQKIHG